MPKYIIWTGGKPRRSLPPDTVYLRLRLDDHEGVQLEALNANGSHCESGYILSLNREGKLRRYTGCEVEGLEYDDAMRVALIP